MKAPALLAVSLLFMLTLVGSPRPTAGQEIPPGPTTVLRSSFAVADLQAPFDAIQMVMDLEPGAWTPPHSHGGETLVTVLEGEMTVREEGVETTYRVGESWRETPGAVHAAGNTAADKARIFVTFLLPKGAPLTTVQQSASAQELPPGPSIVSRFQIPVGESPAPLDVIHTVLDFSPGAWTPPHWHGGLTLVTVLESEMAVRGQGEVQTFATRETWVEQPLEIHAAGNDTPAKASVAVTFLLPKGAPLTTVAGTVPARAEVSPRERW